ncbi:MAG: AbrB/MazE/SpoVT family DNA-binding domain-containing protein [Candidatus Nanohalobium sp.]
MAAFISSEEELNKADIQRKSASFTWKTQVDSKGRVTIPAQIRNRLNLSEDEQVSLSIQSRKVVREEVEGKQEALQLLSQFDSVESFKYSDGILEVVLSE